MTRNTHTTREGWLIAARDLLAREFFEKAGYKLPEKMACSCGFPRGGKKAIGQCWHPETSADGTTHMYVCPTQAEPIRVLDILLHEMVHASLGTEVGHKGPFKKVVKEFGLAGKATATYAEEGSECWLRLSHIAEQLGPYPHAAVDLSKAQKKGKGGSGWVRLQSPTVEEYRLVISPKMIEEHGLPLDPWGEQMEPVEK